MLDAYVNNHVPRPILDQVDFRHVENWYPITHVVVTLASRDKTRVWHVGMK